MNTTKMGLFAAAALTVLSAQANANPTTPAAKKDSMVCANTCRGEHSANCGGHAYFKGVNEKACEGKGKWSTKTAEMKEVTFQEKAK